MYVRISLLVLTLAAAVSGCGGGGSSGAISPPTNSSPVAAFTASPSSGTAPIVVQFDGSASSDPDGTISTYAWDFGDGATSSGASAMVSHQYVQSGMFTARLTVTDNSGGQGSTTRTIDLAQSSSGVWLGAWESSLIPEAPLYADLDVTATTLNGTFRDGDGREGTITGSRTGQSVSLQLLATTPGCSGTFTGTGVIDPTFAENTDTILFDFSGTDCAGAHTDGLAVIVLQRSEIMAWGQYNPTGLTHRNGSLFWTDDSIEPLKKLNTGNGNVTPLSTRMRSITSLKVTGNQILWIDGIADIGESGCTGQGLFRALMSVDANGSNVRELATGDFCGNSLPPDNVLTDSSYAYWVVAASNTPGTIQRVPLAGGASETLASPGVEFSGFAIDATYLYWSEVISNQGSTIYRCPIAGCAGQPPVTIHSSDDTLEVTTNIHIVGNRLVFGIRHLGVAGYEISSMPKAGGAITDIAHSDDQVLRILSDGSSVFWLSGDALRSVPVGGGAVTTVVADFFYVQGIAIGTNRVYWADASFQGGFSDGIYYTSKTGGLISTLTTATSPAFVEMGANGDVIYADGGPSGLEPVGIHRVNSTGTTTNSIVGLAGASVLAADDINIYTAQGFNIMRTDRDGGDASLVAKTGFYPVAIDTDGSYVYWVEDPQNIVLRVPVDQFSAPTLVGVGNSRSSDLKISGGYAYWLGGSDSLYRAPVSGGTTETLANDLRFPTNLIVDNQYVYVVEADAGSLTRLTLNGSQRVSIGGTGPYYGWFALAQDTNRVYWATPVGLFSAAKSGGSTFQYSITVYQDQFDPEWIAVDDQSIYWTEAIFGAVKRAPK